jgi:predicted nucleic acid-binding protein
VPNTAWIDAGFFVALFARNDKRHASAQKFLKANQTLELHTLWSVIAEAAFFLDAAGKDAMLEWVAAAQVVVHELTSNDVPALRATLKKYSNLEPDFTDAALVMLANTHRINQVITVDSRDFSIYRVNSKPFLQLWI